MKHKQLSDYLTIIKAATYKEDYIKAKHLGESALKRLSGFSYSPLDEYNLYFELGSAYVNLAECSRSVDAFYKASSIAARHRLGPAYIAHTTMMIASNFVLTKNIDLALNQYQAVVQYYEKYGYATEPMPKRYYVTTLVSLAYCYLYKNDLEKVEDILERQLLPYRSLLSGNGLGRLDYIHFKGEYLINKKEYDPARQAFEECVKISEILDFPSGKLEAQIHLAIICLLKNQTDDAIDILLALFSDAQRFRLPSLACEAALLLSRCYTIKNMKQQAEAIEEKIRPLLAKLDVVWFYERRQEFERLYSQLHTAQLPPQRKSLKATDAGIPARQGVRPVPDIITNTLDRHYESSPYKDIVGRSAAMQEVFQVLDKIAPTDLPVVIQGETGTGKELTARAIHLASPRSGKFWLAFNSGAVPETLLESELFGHLRGAFTGAVDRKGYIEAASGGTLFLDEIANMSVAMQKKLLRVLEEKQVYPLGASRPVATNTRFIFASNRNIKEMVNEGLFRADLYYRINIIVVHLPPLRERKDDIPLLIDHFLRKYSPERKVEMSPEAMVYLMNYSWPGNIRELSNEVKRILLLNKNTPTITDAMLSEHIRAIAYHRDTGDSKRNYVQRRKEWERNLINEILKKHNGDVVVAGRELEMSRSGMYKKMKELGITETTKAFHRDKLQGESTNHIGGGENKQGLPSGPASGMIKDL